MLNEETGGYNKTGIVIAVCAILELATRPSSPPVKEGKSGKPKDVSHNAKDISRSWIPSSIALGSLFFTLHCMFTDSSTIIAWSWTGYQDGQPRGPLPHLHGSITLFAQAFGLIIPTILPTSVSHAFLTHPLWFVYGCASAFVMYRFRDWTGFLGGLNFAVFCMSILSPILSQSSAWQRDKVGRRHFVAFFTAILFYLANVWTVAYAFVPGGLYLRERTDLYVPLIFFRPLFQTAFPESSSASWPLSRLDSVSRSEHRLDPTRSLVCRVSHGSKFPRPCVFYLLHLFLSHCSVGPLLALDHTRKERGRSTLVFGQFISVLTTQDTTVSVAYEM